jgi:hypothetical protein
VRVYVQKSIMALYGIYGEHTQEACRLYNKENRQLVLSQNIEKNAQKYGVKILHQFHSTETHISLDCRCR